MWGPRLGFGHQDGNISESQRGSEQIGDKSIQSREICSRNRYLTHLSRMNFPISIGRTSLFQIIGVLSGIYHFYSNFKRNFCKQTVENLIRCRVLRRLIWFCTVCRCPTKRTLGLYGLTHFYCLGVEACFYRDVIKCLPLDPVAHV